jgi:hypothetical protein
VSAQLLKRPSSLMVAHLLLAFACSAAEGGQPDEETNTNDQGTETGGTSSRVDESQTATGGQAPDEVPPDDVTHPLFGAGSYTQNPPTDPCISAQHWEESTNMDLSTGALILKDGVVYEVSGPGKEEQTWADEWTAPPCIRDDAHCQDLGYRIVLVCE